MNDSPHLYCFGCGSDIAKGLKRIFSNRHKCDSPDIYAIVDNTLVIIEHFAFDASREVKHGGMERIKKDRQARAKIEEAMEQGLTEAKVLELVGAELSFSNWTLNFENLFDSHYNKIDKYILNAKNKAQKEQPNEAGNIDTYKVGFFIEEEYPPIVNRNGKLHELNYYETKQFLNFYSNKSRVDFILFGTCFDSRRRLVYIDHNYAVDSAKAIDLQSNDVRMSHINRNEIAFSFVFKI